MSFFNPPDKRLPNFRLTLFACVLTVFVLGLGAFTRLVDAGLGCPDWPTCYGHILWPKTAEEVQAANEAFPDMQVEHDKTWPEMVHRYFASALGFVVILIVFYSWKNRRQNPPLKLPLFLLGFVILQGMFGMWTVTLKLWPQVVTAHLLGGFTTLSLLWLLTLRLDRRYWQLNSSDIQLIRRFKSWAMLGLLIVVCQITLGGWTTSNYAAVACPDLPTCQGQWLPTMDFVQGFDITQHIGPNYLGGVMDNEARVAIHFSHRVGAIITAIYLLVMSAVLLKNIANSQVKSLAVTITSVLILQIVLGLGNVAFNFPVFIAVAHNLVGVVLLLTLVTLNHRIFTARAS